MPGQVNRSIPINKNILKIIIVIRNRNGIMRKTIIYKITKQILCLIKYLLNRTMNRH